MPDEQTPATATQATSPTINAAAMLEEIDKLLGGPDEHIPIAALPRGSRVVWGWIPVNGELAHINVGHAWPFMKSQTVISIFHDEDEIRVYTLANQPPKPGEKLPPTRYTLSKNAPCIVSETMPLEIFKAQLAAEFQAVEEETVELEDFEDEDDTPANGEAKTEATPTPAAS